MDLNGKGWTGQVLQDLVVYQLLGKGGFFLDLAANHALMHSNTYALETFHNWTGLCIDGNPQPWESLSARTCQVVGAVVGQTTMEKVQFVMPADNTFVSRIVPQQPQQSTEQQQQPKPSYRYTVSLLDIARKFQIPTTIDYLSLDVEDAEGIILSGDFLDHYQVKLWTVENPNPLATSRLRHYGYRCLKKITGWGESIWIHPSLLDHQLDPTKLKNLNLSLEEAKAVQWTCGFATE